VLPIQWVFHIPAMVLLAFFVLDFFVIRDTPGHAGFQDFDTADASSGDTGERLPVLEVAKRMFSQSVIPIIIAIEFCSGFLRNAVMKWYLVYADKIGQKSGFVASNWGVLLCAAGILGGMFAGTISDHVFGSRRGPVATVLYGGLTAGAAVSIFILGGPAVGWTVVFMSLCVIGVHGMLSGTASMDFGGKKNAGVATGIIDGFVYLGTAVQSVSLGYLTTRDWAYWPYFLVPFAVIGLVLSLRIWHAKPGQGSGS
jgi:OPA family glycerol-3-phosphate transporter-like MFS transporter